MTQVLIIGIAALIASFVSALIAIWLPSEQWAQTALLLFFAGAIVSWRGISHD